MIDFVFLVKNKIWSIAGIILILFHDYHISISYIQISARDELEFQFKPRGEISARAETIKSQNVAIFRFFEEFS
jgi:hypothetical protein